MSSSPLTTKCLFTAHISHPCIKCTFAEMVTVEWGSIVGTRDGGEVEHVWAVCKHGGASGWVYSKRKCPTGTAVFYLSPGGEREGGVCH